MTSSHSVRAPPTAKLQIRNVCSWFEHDGCCCKTEEHHKSSCIRDQEHYLKEPPLYSIKKSFVPCQSSIVLIVLQLSISTIYTMRVVISNAFAAILAMNSFCSSKALSSANNYLSSLSRGGYDSGTLTLEKPASTLMKGEQINGLVNGVVESIEANNNNADEKPKESFWHAPLAFFDRENMTLKGPRKGADVGNPHDATRELTSVGSVSVGTWWCGAGGWPSPALRTTTEVFFVLSGHGCLTDDDGMLHEFRTGDIVVLPKGWSGRWDIFEDIHKIWFVNEHPFIEETSKTIRALVVPSNTLGPQYMSPQKAMTDVIHGSPRTSSGKIYDAGPTTVGCWACTPGSFLVEDLPRTESFLVLDGTFFLSTPDGHAQRCAAGDTVVLPKGWTGYWDVIETVKKLWVVVE